MSTKLDIFIALNYLQINTLAGNCETRAIIYNHISPEYSTEEKYERFSL
jgi:hypothetical protein